MMSCVKRLNEKEALRDGLCCSFSEAFVNYIQLHTFLARSGQAVTWSAHVYLGRWDSILTNCSFTFSYLLLPLRWKSWSGAPIHLHPYSGRVWTRKLMKETSKLCWRRLAQGQWSEFACEILWEKKTCNGLKPGQKVIKHMQKLTHWGQYVNISNTLLQEGVGTNGDSTQQSSGPREMDHMRERHERSVKSCWKLMETQSQKQDWERLHNQRWQRKDLIGVWEEFVKTAPVNFTFAVRKLRWTARLRHCRHLRVGQFVRCLCFTGLTLENL